MATRFSEMGGGRVLLQEEFMTNVDDNAAAINTGWILIAGAMVFLMQGGFAMLEAGSIRAKNAKNILLKNLLDPCIAAIIWWVFGFPFAFGERSNGGNGWIGANNFFLSTYQRVEQTQAQFLYPIMLRNYTTPGGLVGFEFWFFQWAFAATAATIVSGAVAERCRFCAYLVYVGFLTGFIYPVVVHWVWSGEGWLSPFFDNGPGCTAICNNLYNGTIDFAGSSVVHMTGGIAALVAATILGPRLGRFDADGKVVDIQPHSLPLAALGVFLLWFGWYGFNPGSTLGLTGGYYYIAAKVAATTTLSGAAGGVMVLVVLITGRFHLDLAPILNGILAGLVGICSGAASVETWAAVVIGAIASPIMLAASWMLKKFKIDDPLDAAPVHMFCGMWGMLATGLFGTETNITAVYGTAETSDGKSYYGGFYGGGGTLFGVQIVAILAVLGWVLLTTILLFGTLRVTGLFRISEEDETIGLDVSHHGGSAYEWQAGEDADGMKEAKESSSKRVEEPEPEPEKDAATSTGEEAAEETPAGDEQA